MEQSLNEGIRATFYSDLTCDYKLNGEKSFLFRAFLKESLSELLEEHFPEYPEDGPIQPKAVRALLKNAMGERPEWARDLLLREPPGKARKERRDFFRELFLNDAGYAVGLISDTDYYFWIVEYLAARNVYYKDSGIWDGYTWLSELLWAGLPGREVRTKAEAERALDELAGMIRDGRQRAEAADRLHGLRTGEGRDYLPRLAGWLERMAIHIKIKTWLQDSGYPLRDGDEKARPPKGPRKRDFTMQLFAAYCDGPEGYDFIRKDLGGRAAAGWRLDGNGFCVLDLEQAEQLRSALEQSSTAYYYVPVGFHMRSACTFFLAGKDIYGELYEDADEKSRKAYEDAKGSFCFDFLRLDGSTPQAVGGAFRLRPTFHENVGRSCRDVLDNFKRYCENRDDGPLQAVREFNEECPPGVPDAFRWAFDGLEEPERPRRSQEARFQQSRSRMEPLSFWQY